MATNRTSLIFSWKEKLNHKKSFSRWENWRSLCTASWQLFLSRLISCSSGQFLQKIYKHTKESLAMGGIGNHRAFSFGKAFLLLKEKVWGSSFTKLQTQRSNPSTEMWGSNAEKNRALRSMTPKGRHCNVSGETVTLIGASQMALSRMLPPFSKKLPSAMEKGQETSYFSPTFLLLIFL